MSATISANIRDVPGNVHLESWYPQPAVIPHVDLFIHHGGNNSFNEALFFGKPAIIMPFCWDGLDNAARIHDTGYGDQLPRYTWTEEQLAGMIDRLLKDKAMAAALADGGEAHAGGQGHRQGRQDPGRDRDHRELQAVSNKPRLLGAAHLPTPTDLRRPRRLGRTAGLHRRPSRNPPAGCSTSGRIPRSAAIRRRRGSGSARRANGRSRSRATSSVISSPAVRPMCATTARRSRSARHLCPFHRRLVGHLHRP